MPTSLTLKNIPDDIYERLKASAQRNHRSLNSEMIVCLETVLLSAKVSPDERLSRARILRRSLPEEQFKVCDIDSFKREARP
jgi:antitoxin FitA